MVTMARLKHRSLSSTARFTLITLAYLALFGTVIDAQDCPGIENCSNCTIKDGSATCEQCEEGYFIQEPEHSTTYTTADTDTTTIQANSTTAFNFTTNTVAETGAYTTASAVPTSATPGGTASFAATSNSPSNLVGTDTTAEPTTAAPTTTTTTIPTVPPVTATHPPTTAAPVPSNQCVSCVTVTADCAACEDTSGRCTRCAEGSFLFKNSSTVNSCLYSCPDGYSADNVTMVCAVNQPAAAAGMETWVIAVIAAAGALIIVIIIIVIVVVVKRRSKASKRKNSGAKPLPSINEINGPRRAMTLERERSANTAVQMTETNDAARYVQTSPTRPQEQEDSDSGEEQEMYENNDIDRVNSRRPSAGVSNHAYNSNSNLKTKPKPTSASGSKHVTPTRNGSSGSVTQPAGSYVNVQAEKEEFERRKKEKAKASMVDRDYVNVNKEKAKFESRRRQQNGGSAGGQGHPGHQGHEEELDPPPSGHIAGKKNAHGYINQPRGARGTESPTPAGGRTNNREGPSQPVPTPRRDWSQSVPVGEEDEEEEYMSHDPRSSNHPDYYNQLQNQGGQGYYNMRDDPH